MLQPNWCSCTWYIQESIIMKKKLFWRLSCLLRKSRRHIYTELKLKVTSYLWRTVFSKTANATQKIFIWELILGKLYLTGIGINATTEYKTEQYESCVIFRNILFLRCALISESLYFKFHYILFCGGYSFMNHRNQYQKIWNGQHF